MHVARQINIKLPKLPVTVKWEHISTAHFLPTKAKKSKVIIVRFANRCIKDMVFDHRHYLPKSLGITEHLTPNSLDILKTARDIFGYDFVSTKDCKIIVNLYNKDYIVTSITSIHKLFAWYCELLGENDDASVSQPKLAPVPKSSYASVTKSTPSATNSLSKSKVSSQTFYRKPN